MSNESTPRTPSNGPASVKEMANAEENLRHILAELGVATVGEALDAIRGMKNRASGGSGETLAPLNAEEDTPVTLNDPRRLLAKLRTFTSKIDSLNGTIGSMESQLRSLYADRERLEREIGASEVDDVIAAFGVLQTTIRSMENQLMTLYAGRETLEVELGKSDPTEIVAMFRNIAQMVRGVNQELDYTNLKN